MRNDMTELVFILDRSGSMHGMEEDTIGGFNRVIDDQRKLEGDAIVTTLLFDDTIRLLHDRIPLKNIKPLTENDYRVGGCTALLDAIGTAIDKLTGVMRQMGEDGAGHVQFVIVTDGMENASKNYDLSQIRQRIIANQAENHWDFLFLGANMDAISVAGSMGIRAERAVETVSDRRGVSLQYEALSQAVTEFREADAACFPTCSTGRWKRVVERDTKARGRRK